MKIIKFIKLPNRKKKQKLKTIIFNLFYYKIYKKKIQGQLKNEEFTIISNNCFAGSIYQDLALEYKTPTVGLFFYSECYMKFVFNLEYYLKQELLFTKDSKYIMKATYPIGILDDVEIHFLHYSSEKEALNKWNRRKQRIKFKNLFFVFSDRDGFNKENYEQFLKFEGEKVLFTANKEYKADNVILLKEFSGDSQIGEITLNKWAYVNEFNIADFLNKSERNDNIFTV